MFNLLPPVRTIGSIAGLYAFACVLVVVLVPQFGIVIKPSLVMTGAGGLELLLLAFCMFGWRWVWRKLPILNEWFYPDLNGYWKASIRWVNDREGTSGVASGTVSIKQNFLRVSIEMDASNSTSETVALVVKKDPESGRPALYYIYDVHERHVAPGQHAAYRGAASLKVAMESRDGLSGNYFTSRGTAGHFDFQRLPSATLF